MIGIGLDPLDTLFFRDGTPYSADSAPQEDVASLFPPHPTTVAGALRAALARCNGWNGRRRWPEPLESVLGDGPDDAGKIAMEGPFLLRDDRPLFPAPRHLLGTIDDGRWTPRLLLRPGSAVMCDLGDAVRLPEAPTTFDRVEKCKTGDGWWLTLAGMESVLHGQLPRTGEVVSSQCLWSEESRIGLGRDRSRRTAEEGKLYSSRHVRLKDGVSLGLRIDGVPSDWTLPADQLVPLGGESRLAACRTWSTVPTLRTPLADIEDGGRITMIALTPLDLDEAVCRGRRQLDVPGNVKVVSACLSRPERIGGWSSLERRPLPLRSVLPAGSVLFCRADDPRRFIDAIAARNGLSRLGSRQAWGFGLTALGAWSDELETNS